MSVVFIVFFAILSFLTSLLTSIFSLGGGLIMLVALAQAFSPATLIPLHGSIQLANNFSRTLVYREFFQWKLIKHIVISTMFGAVIGIYLFGTLPENLLVMVIAATILFLTWAPLDSLILSIMKNDWFCGFISGFAGIFVGANGPLATAYLRTKNLSPEVLVANHGAIMIIQHGIKIILFASFFNFIILDYFIFILILALTGYAGAILGRRLISKVPFKSFNIILKVLLTLLAFSLFF